MTEEPEGNMWVQLLLVFLLVLGLMWIVPQNPNAPLTPPESLYTPRSR